MRTGRRLPPQIRVLVETQYGIFFVGNGLSLVGSWMQRIACSWLVWDWTGSAFWVGILAACELLPVLVIGPLAGVAADRWDRLRQNRVVQLLSAGVAVTLAVLYAMGWLSLGVLILLATLEGTLMGAVQAARLAMVNQMVPREDLAVAVALTSVAVNLARMLGPAVAGVLIMQADIVWVFAVNAAFTLLFVLILGRLRLMPRDAMPVAGNFLAQLFEGFRYLLASPPLRVVLGGLLLGGMFLRSLLELAPAVAAHSFSNSAAGLAILTSSAGAGAVLAALAMRQSAMGAMIPRALGWWAFGAVAALALIHAGSAWLAVPAAALVGAAITRAMVGTQTFVQMTTPDMLRGRMLSVFGLLARASPALGALIIGFAADRTGLPPAVTTAAVALVLCVGALLSLDRGRGGGVE